MYKEVFYLDKVAPLYPQESAIRLASQVGLSRPLYCSAVGKAILADMTESEVRYIWENSLIEKKTEHTITEYEELLEDLIKIRERGYALDNEENEMGVRCIAVSIKNHKEVPNNAFSISAPAVRMSDERIELLAQEVLKTKIAVQKALGHHSL